MSPRATSYDVARRAGVSQSAVSRTFKPGASVSAKTRDKVIKAAEELGYRPNAIARSLISRRSNMIAVLVSGQLNFYYPEVLFQLTSRFSEEGQRVLLFTIDDEADVAHAIDQIWQYQADGVISASYLSVEQHQLLQTRGIPVVMFNRFFADHPTTTVWCDPSPAVDAMMDRLHGLGHRRYGLLEGPDYSMVNRLRMQSVRAAIARLGAVEVATARGDYRYESAAHATRQLMSDASPTAVIAANDMMAMGVMDELRQGVGLSVPGDVSVTGFDGIGAARFSAYELTTIRQPIARMADAAVSLLLARVEEPDTSDERRVLEGTFLEGASIGPAYS